MDVFESDTVFVDDIDSQPESPIEQPGTKPSGSGITLVLPSLKSIKAANASKKSKGKASASGYNTPVKEKRAPRPLKLKPLKEVITKLIAQIKKKDDYAFFLQPVDTTLVPGYTDIIKHPMDFGTMSNKVAKGRYRSLEEFADDFRLVVNNAKTFNPPGTPYHNEAQKIETWGLDHIAKASATVIQYETDWNIEVEKDDEPDNNRTEDDVEPMDVDTPGPRDHSATPGPSTQPSSRRSTRAPYRKAANPPSAPATKSVKESVDPEGRLPGSKDGLGAFPAGSDWAATMLALKLKGKRYKTKKERLRIEKEGPPLRADGSLDYFEMEDPFATLSALVPDPVTRPTLTPLYPPLLPPSNHLQSQSQTPQPPAQFPTAINTTQDRPLVGAMPTEKSTKFRYWTIQRNANSRNRPKDREEDREENEESDWKVPREAHASDFGSFTLLAAELAEEMKRRGTFKDEEEGTFTLIRDSLEPDLSANRPLEKSTITSPLQYYWSVNRAVEGENYIRDVVYGGASGLAYVRSVAEFLTPPSDILAFGSSSSVSDLPMTGWAEQNVVDALTDARHSLLRKTPFAMARLAKSRELARHMNIDQVNSQVAKSMHVYPIAIQALVALKQIRLHKIDMSSLIKAPEELFLSEAEWVGKSLEGKSEDTNSMNIDGGRPTSEKLDQVLSYVSRAILENNRKPAAASSDGAVEDPSMRHLRLNLLALAKRAPLDTIARLPRELVPEQVRQYIPTFSVAQPTVQTSAPAAQTSTPIASSPPAQASTSAQVSPVLPTSAPPAQVLAPIPHQGLASVPPPAAASTPVVTQPSPT
ncbi:hypothetical protein PM082_001640 [Marasmius tenuissimus]|nr:hypothetical protein PM082_001640 [Marasmius tenuissimus]